jgi:hypothetical protein
MAAPISPAEPVRLVPPGYCDWRIRFPEHCGPWEYGDNIYGCFNNLAYFDVPPMTDGFQMYKSEDRGATWAVVDPHPSSFWGPLQSNNDFTNSFVRIGNDVYLIYGYRVDSSLAKFTYRLTKFDLTTETWTADVAGDGPTVTMRKTPFSNDGTTFGRAIGHRIEVRNGKIYLFYFGGYNGAGWQIANFITWSPDDGWGTPTELHNDAGRHHYVMSSVVAGNNIHVLLCSDEDIFYNLSANDVELHHVTLSINDVPQTYQTITNDVFPVRNKGVGHIAYGSVSGQLAVNMWDSGGGQSGDELLHCWTADEASNPSWSDAIVPMPVDAGEIASDWYWSITQWELYGCFFATPFFWDGDLYVLSSTSYDPGLTATGPEKCNIWLQKRVGDSWENTRLWQIFDDPNPDDLDNKSYYLLGSFSWGQVAEGIGIFFFGQDLKTPTERDNVVDQREYYLVAGLAVAAPLNFAYYGMPIGVTAEGNYSFFV